MKTRAWVRALLAVWGLWFTAALSEPAGLHTCRMHGSHATAHTSGGHSSDAHSGHGAPSHASKDCTCLGLCCGASIASPRVSVPTEVVSARVETAAAGPECVAPRITRAHALPFANGPPSAI